MNITLIVLIIVGAAVLLSLMFLGIWVWFAKKIFDQFKQGSGGGKTGGRS